MYSTTVKIAVIGGGPAGSAVATILAKQGYQVRLYERERFPRAHIGESLLPATLAILDELGVLDKVKAAGFTVKNGATMSWGRSNELWSWYFKETNRQYPHSYQVNRPHFDQLLLNHARSNGVHVHEGCRVEDVRFAEGQAQALLVNGEFEAFDYIVDASGQRSLISNKLNLKQWDEELNNLAVYSYFKGGEHLSGLDSGNILIEATQIGWLWKIPLKDGISSVGLVGDRDQSLETIRSSSTDSFLMQGIGESRYVHAMLTNAKRINDVQLTRDWSYVASQFTGPTHCLVGDAACFVDPLFSTGVHLAISGALLAAALVTTTIEHPHLADIARTAYERAYRTRYFHFQELVHLFYSGNDTEDTYFWRARRIRGEQQYQPRAAFIRAISGQSPAGYERSWLIKGRVPQSLENELDLREDVRQKVHSLIEQNAPKSLLVELSPDVKIIQDAVLSGDRYTLGWVVRGEDREDLPINEKLSILLRLCKHKIALSDLTRSVKPEFNSTGVDESQLVDAIRLFAQDGILMLWKTN